MTIGWGLGCEVRRQKAQREDQPSAAVERRPANPSALDDDANGATGGAAEGNGGTSSAEPNPRPSFASDSANRQPISIASGSMGPALLAPTRLIVLGDYGWAGPREQQVAELVHELRPDYVLTTGDNNYPEGSAATIDQNIGQYFSDFIYPYKGQYPSAARENRFFPVLGNHDWYSNNAAAYLAYFTLPGNERYYDVVLGDVHFFALDSDEHEPDGVSATSEQARWLQARLGASKSAFNLVAMHHPPFSSGPHGDTSYMQWPYAEWGADVVLAGHDHCYERLHIDGIMYIVSGLGGASLYSFAEPTQGSVARYNESYGATLLEANSDELRSSFYNIDGKLIDTITIRRRPRR
ncbi:MAG TPA: metallophosphoesterase [Polyangiaceae bacterium]|nr:metallophosphoesterase [Polyangiaceae bacterium]